MSRGRPSRRRVLDAVVVGGGPNGLTAAGRLAREGWSVTVFEAASTVGGGCRTKPLFGGAMHDVCASVHPFGIGSPAFEALGVEQHGLRWLHPPVPLAHPFDDGDAAVLLRSVADTAAGLGDDGQRWRAMVGFFAAEWPELRHLLMQPVVRAGLRHPLRMARFGAAAGLPATWLAHRFHHRDARALLGGLAAHSGALLSRPTSAAIGLTMAAAAHAVGMPVAAGGSQSVVDALASIVLDAGGRIECDRPIASLRELPRARATLLDVTPGQLAAMADARAPHWRHGVAAWKLDLVLSAAMPWTAAACRQAGTVHLGGELPAIVAAERQTARGALPTAPYIIVTQPSVVDPSRAPAGQHVLWAYRHVPNSCSDPAATAGIEAQFDRFAPGWRELVVASKVTRAMDYAAYNLSYPGGDIAGGAMTPWQTVARPRLALDPYRTRVDGVWLCSQSTPPGPGVHGMCGWNAAGSVLRATRRARA